MQIDATKEERSLLLYFESRLVDHSGIVDQKYMNAQDFEIAEKWASAGIIEFGRIAGGIKRGVYDRLKGSYWVLFSEKVWAITHRLRRERSERMVANAPYERTCDRVREDHDE